MPTKKREVHVEWAPEWWAHASREQFTGAVRTLQLLGARSIVIGEEGFRFRFDVPVLDPLSCIDQRLLELRRTIEALG